MKLGDARDYYITKVQTYRNMQADLLKEKSILEKKIKETENGKELFAKEAATLDISFQSASAKQNAYQTFLEKLSTLHTTIYNGEVTKQQADAAMEFGKDLTKLLEVARRIARGATVPSTDEQKLMEYSMELYMSAKNLALMAELRDKEDYDSLWEEDQEAEALPDPDSVANNTEVDLELPSFEE